MGAVRAVLLKRYRHKYACKDWVAGTIVQGSPEFISELVADKIAEVYNGEYPPKGKRKFELNKLK